MICPKSHLQLRNSKERNKNEPAKPISFHKSLQSIPGSADNDNREIQQADEIRLRAISVIESSIGLLR